MMWSIVFAAVSGLFAIATTAIAVLYPQQLAPSGRWRRPFIAACTTWAVVTLVGGGLAIAEAQANAEEFRKLREAIEALRASMPDVTSGITGDSNLSLPLLGVGAIAVGAGALNAGRFGWLVAGVLWAALCFFFVWALLV